MFGVVRALVAAQWKMAAPAFRFPDFLLPPRMVLFNPAGYRGAEGLPVFLVLIDKLFFGIPFRYLSRDRFGGCAGCDEKEAAQAGRALPAQPRSGTSGRRSPQQAAQSSWRSPAAPPRSKQAGHSARLRGPQRPGPAKGPSSS